MRTPTQIRPLSAQRSILARADGSCQFSFGTLSAYASTLGPIESSRIRDELIDRATLQIHISPLIGAAGIASKGLAQAWTELFESVILVHLHPRSLVQINVQLGTGPPGFVPPPTSSANVSITSDSLLIGEEEEAEEDAKQTGRAGRGTGRNVRPSAPHPNSTFSVAQRATMINAAMVALLDSGIAMQATVAACSCAYVPSKHANRLRRKRPSQTDADMEEDQVASGDAGSVLVLDPSPEEEFYASSTHVFAFGFAGRPPPFETPAQPKKTQSCDVEDAVNDASQSPSEEDDEEILYAESHGRVSLEQVSQAAKLCRRAARDLIVPFYRLWLSEQQQSQAELQGS
ncbi:exosome non-catalytic core subunit rrp46 [Tilletia horrida]|nr:exosome non-catalytic core subunit rrp46 [Tilletia horrida]